MPKKNYITYEPINWANGKDNGTPVNADNLNNMEQAIVDLTDAVNTEVATDDIEDGAVTGAKIAQGTITKDNLDKTLGESITPITLIGCERLVFAVTDAGAYIQFCNKDGRVLRGFTGGNGSQVFSQAFQTLG